MIYVTSDESITWHNLSVFCHKSKEGKECYLKKSFMNDNIKR
jgi:hypothetical protein